MKFRDLVEGDISSPMMNTSKMKHIDGTSIEFSIDDKKIQVTVDKELPAVFILSKIETLIESIEKEIKSRI